ncbi:L,D-transpeptidase [Bauldia sp.]|uniref:L,D-transpeptidase n=1 Tax=Bauldia sp. TaxID=2575872 RepID=UPI003BAB09E8
MTKSLLSRRAFMLGGVSAGGLALAGCTTTPKPATTPALPPIDPAYVRMYAPIPEERFPIPAPNLRKIDPSFYRRVVKDPTGERPGTLVVNTGERALYLVRDDGTALRYGIGIGRAGFEWSGRAMIAAKRQWPTWTPPAEMIEREPELEEWRGGMPPGLENPLGARALYIHEDGVDTLYRLHGTIEDWSIGRAVSSGCVRLLNQDVIDLYQRVPVNTPILVV